MYRKLLVLTLAAAMLAACGEEQPKQDAAQSVCQDPAVLQSVRSNIQEVIKQEARAFARNDNRQFVDDDKIIAAGTQLEIELGQAQAAGSGTSCSAPLEIRIPSEIMEAANTNSPLIYGETGIAQLIEQKVMGSRLSFSGNVFATTVRYTPSKTDGVTFQDNTLNTTAQTVSAALLPYGVKSIIMIDGRPVSKEDALKMNARGAYAEPPEADPEDILENNAASRAEGVPAGSAAGLDADTEILSPRTDDTAQAPAVAQYDLDNARVQNRQAEADITGVWNGMDRAVQQSMVAEQRSWLQNKSQNCMQAAAPADNPAQAEYLQLQCDTRMTRERTQYLRGFSINN